jgi:N-acetylneuraminic acid mutarotase
LTQPTRTCEIKFAMKKIYVLFAIIIFTSQLTINSLGQSPNTWTQKANFGGAPRLVAVGFSIGNKGYIGTGGIGGLANDFWEYDPSSNTWTQKANFPGTPRYGAVGFSIGAYGYIGTGYDTSDVRRDFWQYDPSSNTWTQKASFGGTARDEAVGFSIGTKGYIGTGYDTSANFVNDFWEYDPTTDTWTQKANYAGTTRMSAVGFGIGTKGYIGTGSFFDDEFWEYDPSANIWTQKANFGGLPRVMAVGFSIGSLGYIGTGDGGFGVFHNDFWEYNPTADMWTQKANFGGTARKEAVGFSIGSQGYIGTGEDGSYKNDFWQYTPTCSAPAPPTNTTPSANQNICTGYSTVLSASGLGTLGWYSAATGGTWLGGGGTYTTPVLTSNTTFYVQDSTCTASLSRTAIPVTVNPPPIPTITGNANMCVNSGYYNYTTEVGMQNYSWSVSSGGVIDYGSGTNQITVSWIVAGNQTVSITYTSPGGCSPANPTILNITVNPLPDQAGNITGNSIVCAGSSGVVYSVAAIPNTTTYVWSLPPGATITSGAGTNAITVDFAINANPGNIFVYGNNICGDGGTSPAFPVSITALPDPAGTISGPSPVCQGDTGKVYTVPPIYGASSYSWSLPSGAYSVSGSGSNTITVDFSNTAVSGNITVYGSNSCGNGTVSPYFPVIVNDLPPKPLVTNTGDTLHSNSLSGNQWYFQGTKITGATGQDYVATQQGYYWDIVTLDGCPSDTSNHKLILVTEVENYSSLVINVFPIPNDGRFNVLITTTSRETFSINVYNNLGIKVYEEKKVDVNGSLQKVIDLRPVPNGVYTLDFKNSQNQVVKKIVVYK